MPQTTILGDWICMHAPAQSTSQCKRRSWLKRRLSAYLRVAAIEGDEARR